MPSAIRVLSSVECIVYTR